MTTAKTAPLVVAATPAAPADWRVAKTEPGATAAPILACHPAAYDPATTPLAQNPNAQRNVVGPTVAAVAPTPAAITTVLTASIFP